MQFHFILTVTWPTGTGLGSSTFEGTITSRPGQTRRDLYKSVRDHAIAQTGTSRINVSFFDLAPNELPALASSAPR